MREDVGDTDFIITRYVDPLDHMQWHKALLLYKNFLQEVLVDHELWWNIKLTVYTRSRM